MPKCPSCASAIPEGSRFCGSCGAALETPTSAPTETSLKSKPRAGPLPTSDQARFIPGTVLAKRYRIISLLGHGGMGEVYRADDLKLGQPVALKFLPADVQRDRARLDRFLNEVKTALRVSHPNVCRVHDIGEVDGQHYLSMEYVDGEDLASLLRRIERLPQNKAVQIARQLCASLAAAHEQGILHRDLKPANVMIDGRGRAKITDFGLASLADVIEGDEVRAGTPQYMSPEQHAGKEVTVHSDIYSLGLVFYELFTGKRAFEAASPSEIRKLQEESSPTTPSSHVEGLDPAVERVILRCIEKDPAQRPASALAISSALPGGDPLAAVLAAGETPSPEMVAQAGGEGAIHPALGSLLVVVILAGLLAGFHLESSRITVASLDRPPEELSLEARQFIQRIGLENPQIDHTHGFQADDEFYGHIGDEAAKTADAPLAQKMLPRPVFFWYRQSPRNLLPIDAIGYASWNDPPHDVPGMIGLKLDGEGRLLSFRAVPQAGDEGTAAIRQVDWSIFLESAGLDANSAEQSEPSWNPILPFDDRTAWEATYPDQAALQVRVEAGSFKGRPVYFEIVPPWRTPEGIDRAVRAEDRDLTPIVILYLVLFTAGALLARRNIRLGRADMRGALRIAGFIFASGVLSWAFRANHAPSEEARMVLYRIAAGFFKGFFWWLMYIALEPYARRLWPELLVSWTRLLGGRFSDPRVGRDVLIGGAGAVVIGSATILGYFLLIRAGFLPALVPPPDVNPLVALSGLPQTIGVFSSYLTNAFTFPIVFLMMLVISKALLRRQWAAILATTAIGATIIGAFFNTFGSAIFILLSFLWLLAMLLFFIRFGFLAAVAFEFISNVFVQLPTTIDPSSWYFGRSMAVFLIIAALLLYAYRCSFAGRTLFRGALLPEVDGS